MPNFRFTCARHLQAFEEAAKRGGCTDPEQLDELRRKVLAWLSRRYPRHVLDHFNEGSCLPCKLESARVDTAEVERLVTELARELGSR